MLLSIRDFHVLKLLRFCRYIRQDDLVALFSSAELSHLQGCGFIAHHTASGSMVLTAKGQTFLDAHCLSLPPAISPSYHPSDIQRRLRLSSLLCTAYKAGLSVFLSDPQFLTSRAGVFLSATTRGRGINHWGSSRIAGLSLLDGTLYGIHYVCPNIGDMALSDEVAIFARHPQLYQVGKPAFLFAAPSYEALLGELFKPLPSKINRLVPYSVAYAKSTIPIHLMTCDAVGALQLSILRAPDHRSLLAWITLASHYAPPPLTLDCDALYNGQPFYVAVDMDLKRLDRGATEGFIHIVALESQVSNVLHSRYEATQKGKVYKLTDSALEQFFETVGPKQWVEDGAYINDKGEVVYAPPIKFTEKPSRSGGKK
ncbi:hypothetical protein RFF05_14220 [Bengtsoniella intestinalis]|uniref:hypothetical protein n=1 Tax=Bengtsoniella intestinalis TaxID=3073143 RepID=UPI00391F4486